MEMLKLRILDAAVNRVSLNVDLNGNLILHTDRRPSHANYEFSSWSEMQRARLIEAKTFGTWEFK